MENHLHTIVQRISNANSEFSLLLKVDQNSYLLCSQHFWEFYHGRTSSRSFSSVCASALESIQSLDLSISSCNSPKTSSLRSDKRWERKSGASLWTCSASCGVSCSALKEVSMFSNSLIHTHAIYNFFSVSCANLSLSDSSLVLTSLKSSWRSELVKKCLSSWNSSSRSSSQFSFSSSTLLAGSMSSSTKRAEIRMAGIVVSSGLQDYFLSSQCFLSH